MKLSNPCEGDIRCRYWVEFTILAVAMTAVLAAGMLLF